MFTIGLGVLAARRRGSVRPLPHRIALLVDSFAFGLVAFGFLGMGPVTIAVDSYGPVTDNAQSVFELSLIEQIPDVKAAIARATGRAS